MFVTAIARAGAAGGRARPPPRSADVADVGHVVGTGRGEWPLTGPMTIALPSTPYVLTR
jgi:hypothetical protein